MGGDWGCGEEGVRVWVEIAKDGGGVEAVDEEGGSACAAGVLEQMENLHAAGIGLYEKPRARVRREIEQGWCGGAYKISVVCVGGQGHV